MQPTTHAFCQSSGRPVRIALIGVSGYANCHYKTILDLAGQGIARLDAATIINQEQEAEKCARLRAAGCRIYSDYQAMLAAESGNIDLCSIPTGIGWHRTMAVATLEAGMHVLVEKPVAATLEEVAAIRQARERSGRQVFVGFQNMYADQSWQVKRRLIHGEFGQLQRIRVCALSPRPKSYYHRTNWAGKLHLGSTPIFDSPANNAMAHFIQMALFWAGSSIGDAAQITSLQSSQYRAQQIESFDTFSARAVLNSGAELIINLSHSAEQFAQAQVAVDTDKAQYIWNDATGSTLTYRNQSQPSQSFPPNPDTRLVMFQNICAQLNGTDSPTCTLEVGEAHTALIDRVHHNLLVTDIPQHALQTVTKDGEEFTQVKGLAAPLLEAHKRGCTLAEVGLPWQTQ